MYSPKTYSIVLSLNVAHSTAIKTFLCYYYSMPKVVFVELLLPSTAAGLQQKAQHQLQGCIHVSMCTDVWYCFMFVTRFVIYTTSSTQVKMHKLAHLLLSLLCDLLQSVKVHK